MPEKLLTTEEAASYLDIAEEEVVKLSQKGELPAYKIGGAFLRFRREQLDAIRKEILPRKAQAIHREAAPKRPSAFYHAEEPVQASLRDTLADFFYFKDFYIISAAIVVILLFVIFKH